MQTIRKEIDQIDSEIIRLLTRRFQCVLSLIDQKEALSDPKREKEILSKIHSPYIQGIYQEIFKNSKKMLVDHGFHELRLRLIKENYGESNANDTSKLTQ